MVKVSKMSGKLEGIEAINTNPLTNSFCKAMATNAENICSRCYATRALKGVRRNCVKSYQDNTQELSKRLEPKDLPKIKTKFGRINAFGEIINDEHLLNVFDIATANPSVMFGLWTKRKDLIKKYQALIPDNMNVIYSSPVIDTAVPYIPEGYHKVFSVYTSGYASAHKVKVNCGKNICVNCKLCYTKNSVKYINELIK